MKSRYSGSKCQKCFQPIMEGNEITKDNRIGKWVHSDCKASNFENAQRAKANNSLVAPVQYRAATTERTYNVDALAAVLEEEETEEPKKEFSPTPNQVSIFEFVKDPHGYCERNNIPYSPHAMVEAVAGSGKTTTIVKALDLTPADADVAFVAFNTHIVAELKKRAPQHVYVSTLHSLGRMNIQNYLGKSPRIEKDKLGGFMNDIWPVSKQALEQGLITKEQRRLNFQKRISMRSLVSISKSILVDPSDSRAVTEMIDRYNVEVATDNIPELMEMLPLILQRCQEQVDVIDFDDMIWLPVVLNMPLMQFDYLMVDEAQDMNKSQISMILRSVKENGRIIAVGDRNQSLYAFRGADSDAIPNIIEALEAVTLPLSVTFRCPASHVRIAQKIVPQIEARENAPEGSLMKLDYFNLVSSLSIGDLVICRTNGPLVRPAFECIRRGKKAVIRGKDIGTSLVDLIKTFETDDLSLFDVLLGQYYEHEYVKLMDRAKEMQALLLQDKVETIRAIANEVNTVRELINKISMLFDDGSSGIVFSSIHKAKGLEADNIFILRPDLMPHPMATKEYEVQQELNCLYVAITRSKDNLCLVIGDENGPMKGELFPALKEVV